MANLVTFAKKLWKDKVGGNTPITAAELNRMEGGISDCATQINKLGDSVSRCTRVEGGLIDASVAENITQGGADAIMLRIETSNGKKYALCINLGKTIELYDRVSDKTVWKANLSSLC